MATAATEMQAQASPARPSYAPWLKHLEQRWTVMMASREKVRRSSLHETRRAVAADLRHHR